MSTLRKFQQTIRNVLTIPEQIISYILEAARRIFGPNDDQYPATGVQPFAGKTPDKKKWKNF